MSEMGNQQERLTRYRCDTASSDDYTSSAGSPVIVLFLAFMYEVVIEILQ